MKWTNKGHELDAIGAEFLKCKNLFIWGVGKFGKKAIKLLKWLQFDKDVYITFIDSDKSLQGQIYEDTAIISPEAFFKQYNEETDVLAISSEWVYDDLIKLYPDSLPNYYIFHATKRPDCDLMRRFVTIYLYYKRGILVSTHTNYIITTVCNLNCVGCLNFTNYIKNPADEPFEAFKKHMEIVFSKFDLLASFHFSGGEVLVHKEFNKFLRYVCETYRDRIHELYFVTNGTIVPDEELLSIMKQYDCAVLLDDYRESVPRCKETFPKAKELFEKNNIDCRIALADYWYELGLNEDRSLGSDISIEEVIKHKDECGVHYFQDFYDGKIFGCAYVSYANDVYPNKAGIYTADSSEYLDIANSSKAEILEFRYGYTEKGYFEMCRRCSELHGKASQKIPVAQQVKR